MMAESQVYFFRSKITFRAYQNDLRSLRFFYQVNEIFLFFPGAVRNIFLCHVCYFLLAEQQFISYGLMQYRKPALLRLKHGAYKDRMQPVVPEFLLFSSFANQWNDLIHSYLGGLFQKPFKPDSIF